MDVICHHCIAQLPDGEQSSFMAMKFTSATSKNNLPKIILVAIAIIAAIFLKWLAVPVVFLVYIILSIDN